MDYGPKNRDLAVLVEESVREALEDIGGESVRNAIIFHLEKDYNVSLERVASNPAKLTHGLQQIFGSGSAVIEKKIAICLAKKISTDPSGKSLATLIAEARNLTESY